HTRFSRDWSSDVCSSDLGAASAPHTHARSAFIYAYVISGAIESKVNDGETRIYRAGQSWSEPPNATHSISRNASKTEPAKLLAEIGRASCRERGESAVGA